MSLTARERELVAVGTSLAAGCKPCTDYHLKKVRKAGASDEEIEQAMKVAIAVRDKAEKIMERHGFKLLGFKRLKRTEDEDEEPGETTRMTELVSVGAAFAVSCTSSLEEHVAIARSVGVEDDEIEAVVRLAQFIKGKAESLCCKLI
jgi:AhpD family alkylhydroperoxidase